MGLVGSAECGPERQRGPVTPDAIIGILSGAGGDPSHVRTPFGDVSLAALDERAGWRRG